MNLDILEIQRERVSIPADRSRIGNPVQARPRVALLVPDGPGLRNFVLGPFLRRASETADVAVLHQIPDHLLPRYRKSCCPSVRFESVSPFGDTPLSFILRNSAAYGHMYWADTGAMRYNRAAPIRGSWKTRAATHLARAVGRATASPARLRIVDACHEAAIGRSAESEQYRRLFRDLRPSVLFCSNQRAPIAAPAVVAARRLGIPTATFIFSWDNITSKGRIVVPFDHYLVWSDHMRDELLRFYPNVTAPQVHVVGTPQFDSYADPQVVLSRQDFIRRIGGDPCRPLICYSGGDPTVYKAEYEYVRLLMRMIRENRIVRAPQVVLRPSPSDDGGQYQSVRQEFPELLYLPSAWIHTRAGDWTAVLPLPEDVEMLANLTRHADVNINLNSTMTLDFAIQGRPVINLAFDVLSPPPFGRPLWDFFYQFDHYRPVIELGAARFARTPVQLLSALNAYLEDPGLDRRSRRLFVELEVGVPIGQSSDRVMDVLATIGGATPPPPRRVLAVEAAGTA